jgi:hypothetical protein
VKGLTDKEVVPGKRFDDKYTCPSFLYCGDRWTFRDTRDGQQSITVPTDIIRYIYPRDLYIYLPLNFICCKSCLVKIAGTIVNFESQLLKYETKCGPKLAQISIIKANTYSSDDSANLGIGFISKFSMFVLKRFL